jgi:hypothetical protein
MNDRTETISEQQVKEYLESVVAATIVPPKRANWKYKRNEELVLHCGFPMEWKPLPETIAPVEPGFCYWNCQQLALANINLTYVEGYALDAGVGFPIAHAWLLDTDFRAIDPTWNSQASYFGIPFDAAWVRSFLAVRRRDDNNLSIVDGNYLDDFSLLRDGLPAGALAKTRKI